MNACVATRIFALDGGLSVEGLCFFHRLTDESHIKPPDMMHRRRMRAHCSDRIIMTLIERQQGSGWDLGALPLSDLQQQIVCKTATLTKCQ